MPAVSAVSVFRWCLFWIACGSVATIILDSYKEGSFLEKYELGYRVGFVTVITASVCLLNILLWCHYTVLYPLAVQKGWLCLHDLQRYFRVCPIPDRAGFFSYRIPLPFPLWFPCLGNHHTFGYLGEVDVAGRPHGLGTWFDDARHGECLQGVWQHGRPIGPFRSAEYQTDYRFANVRLGICTNRMEPTISERWWRPTFSSHGLRWGVASLEQSVAGKMSSDQIRSDASRGFDAHPRLNQARASQPKPNPEAKRNPDPCPHHRSMVQGAAATWPRGRSRGRPGRAVVP